MKHIVAWVILLLLILSMFGCKEMTDGKVMNASEYGILPENDGDVNSANLQSLIDKTSKVGGTIYIPAGVYYFSQGGTQTIGAHCIKMRSNVHIIGAGDSTVLKPVGPSVYGLDMFYFNEYLDTGEPVYLENCSFEDFVIDAEETSCNVYTSAGKGFMFNLFRNCHWKNITVMNTDATGFGVDCPVNSTISDCSAVNCGKAASTESNGASGFGIGFGFAEQEDIMITNCTAVGNRKFGFFFEHQGRFDSIRYSGGSAANLRVSDCIAEGNLYNFGGILANNAVFDTCISENALAAGYYFEECENCSTLHCTSTNDKADIQHVTSD